MSKPVITYLKDYQPPLFLIDSVFLHFDLQDDVTTVKSVLKLHRNPTSTDKNDTLILNGEELVLKTILIDGKPLPKNKYRTEDKQLFLFSVSDSFTLETEVEIKPHENLALSGLYRSKGNYCTQCEAHGFRRITYFLDRPDVLTHFTTAISADKQRYPLLLSNGNLIDQKDLGGNRHWVKWEDPSLKPCYLFALVAGDFEYIEDEFITMSGCTVTLRVFVEKGNRNQSQWAMESLKRAMRWDEVVFGREYDLDIFMIVAVSDFNMGAMENKGLNIFNDKYILARPETATDDDYNGIESVIGHEYFHNWSGNRVTVRDWFQITLKEGLTIFRDQSFTADMTSHPVKRIKDVNVIRNYQFAQDAGPMAHPIRPDSYIEVNNFYTVTVYNKGAEVIRMMQTILGKEAFRKAMDLYFERNDGKAVTTEDFVKAMEDASGIDLIQFRRWYSQAGTPILNITDEYNAKDKRYTLYVEQECPPTPDQSKKEEFHIPLTVGLLGSDGKEITSRVLEIKNKKESFQFENISTKPVPSLLRNFSAPVKINFPYSAKDLMFLMKHDTDLFNRWDAGQTLAIHYLLKLVRDYQQHRELVVDEKFIEAFRETMNDSTLDKLFISEMLTLPSEAYLIELSEVADVEAIHRVRKFVQRTLAKALKQDFLRHYEMNRSTGTFELTVEAIGQRRFKNLCLNYLTLLEEPSILALSFQQFQEANNMTDEMSALVSLINVDCIERENALRIFYEKWKNEPLVLDKWFSLQALSTLPGTLERVNSLTQHTAFDIKNPNKVRSLIGVFSSQNNVSFHNSDGKGYEFLADQVLYIDRYNPQLAARLIEPLIRWRKYDSQHQKLMRSQLERIASAKKLSNDVYEIVTKSLQS